MTSAGNSNPIRNEENQKENIYITNSINIYCSLLSASLKDIRLNKVIIITTLFWVYSMYRHSMYNNNSTKRRGGNVSIKKSSF